MTLRELNTKQFLALQNECLRMQKERNKSRREDRQFDLQDFQTIFTDGVRAALRLMPNKERES
jgi:hypothetical protein